MTENQLKQKAALKIGLNALLSTEVDGENLESSPGEYVGVKGEYIIYLERII